MASRSDPLHDSTRLLLTRLNVINDSDGSFDSTGNLIQGFEMRV